MMGRKNSNQASLVFIDLEDYIPQDHLLRLIHQEIDFSFIYDKMQPYYSTVGRKSLDPVLLFKMLLIGYLFGIESERRLEDEVKVNLAYRWFLGLNLTDSVPDHSTFSQNRRRRFKDSQVFQEIFDHIVSLCIRNGLVSGDTIVADSTHIKANASTKSKVKITIEKKPSEYLNTLEEEATRLEAEQNQAREEKGKRKSGRARKAAMETITKSQTDPDTGMYNRPGKPRGFHYVAHTNVDTQHGIILDVFPTAGNVNDCEPWIERLSRIQQRFGLSIGHVGADGGYDTASIHHGLMKLGIKGLISPHKRANHDSAPSKGKFVYHRDGDYWVCPSQQRLPFTHLAWRSKLHIYCKVYSAKVSACRGCSLRDTCFGKGSSHRTIERPIGHELREENRLRSNSDDYKRVQRLRRIWAEGTFAALKAKHNFIKTYKRGIEKIKEQCLFSALALNLKRMIKATR